MSVIVCKIVFYFSPCVTPADALSIRTVRQTMCYVGGNKLELYLYEFSLNSQRKPYFYVDIKKTLWTYHPIIEEWKLCDVLYSKYSGI